MRLLRWVVPRRHDGGARLREVEPLRRPELLRCLRLLLLDDGGHPSGVPVCVAHFASSQLSPIPALAIRGTGPRAGRPLMVTPCM